MNEPRRGLLDHLTVVEAGSGVAVGYAGRCFAVLGARVLKLEPLQGDPSRGTPLFEHLNVSKESVSLDLAQSAGQSKALNLAAAADLLIDSSTGLGQAHLDDSDLRSANPGLVAVRISPLGLTGPYANYTATDLIVQAVSGLMAHSGEPDRAPLRLVGPG